MPGTQKQDIERFIRKFASELRERNTAIFAGAGLSASIGYVNWKELLREVATELGLDVDKEHDLVSLAQYHCNDKGSSRNHLNQIIMDEFSSKSGVTVNHEILARLPITTYWTTNYDKLIENALIDNHKIADVKHDKQQLTLTKHKRDAVVYKMHGDFDNPNQAILIKDDYEKYHETHAPFVTALSGDLVSKTFLFLGFSFTDPNLDYVLSRIRINFDKNQREHYCILRHVPETEDDFEYKRIRQKHFIADLKRFNIKTLLVNEYAEITDILRKIEISYRMNTVFISGSAHEYGNMGEKRALDFVHELSKRLIKEDLTVVSGFGVGIGSAVINGVLEQLREQNTESLDERLVLRPFPQRQTGETAIPVQWDRYRREMIPLAGIALFLFGNKFVGDKVVLADGMRKEFDIAVEHGLKLLPVGATGYVAEALWNEVKDSYTEALREPFLALGDSTLSDEQLIDKIVSIIRVLKRG